MEIAENVSKMSLKSSVVSSLSATWLDLGYIEQCSMVGSIMPCEVGPAAAIGVLTGAWDNITKATSIPNCLFACNLWPRRCCSNNMVINATKKEEFKRHSLRMERMMMIMQQVTAALKSHAGLQGWLQQSDSCWTCSFYAAILLIIIQFARTTTTAWMYPRVTKPAASSHVLRSSRQYLYAIDSGWAK